MSRRASLLADRIEEGAATLAAFAEGLSDAEWRTPVSGTDRRSIGGIVHHVGNMYPTEIDAARGSPRGKAVTDVRWESLPDFYASHAGQNAAPTKARAPELLRRQSLDAAA